jgi:hypothetical protein
MFEALVVMKITSKRLRHLRVKHPNKGKKLTLKPFGNCKGVKKLQNQNMKKT